MLPLVLGGIALAAVGYGVKEYCESEGCPWDETLIQTPNKIDIFQKIEEMKAIFYEEILPKCREMLLVTGYSPKKFMCDSSLSKEVGSFNNVSFTKELQIYSDLLYETLKDASYLLERYLDIAEGLHTLGLWSDVDGISQRELLQRMLELCQGVEKLLLVDILDDQKKLNIETVLNLIQFRDKFEKYKTKI